MVANKTIVVDNDYPLLKIEGSPDGWAVTTPLTVRDLFAGLALAGLIAQSDKQMSVLRLAEESYKCADAMLKQRIETETNNAI